MIRRSEKSGFSFGHVINSRFNSFIGDNELMELSLFDRKFTWARSLNSTSQALLDRCFCSDSWNSLLHWLNFLLYLENI